MRSAEAQRRYVRKAVHDRRPDNFFQGDQLSIGRGDDAHGGWKERGPPAIAFQLIMGFRQTAAPAVAIGNPWRGKIGIRPRIAIRLQIRSHLADGSDCLTQQARMSLPRSCQAFVCGGTHQTGDRVFFRVRHLVLRSPRLKTAL